MIFDLIFAEIGDDAAGGGAPAGGSDSPAADDGAPEPAANGEGEVIPLPDEPEETPAPSPGDARAAGLAEGAAGAYQPNFKFKFMDAEKEIPDWAKPLITNPEIEANVRELFEKSEGLDRVKASREELGRNFDTVRTQFGQQTHAVQQLVGLARRGVQGDLQAMRSFFEGAQIPEEAVLRYAAERYQILSDPALAAQHEAQRRQLIDTTNLTGERDFYAQQASAAAANHRSQELDIALARPDVITAANEFDTRLGRPGAFKAQIIQQGKAHAYLNQGADLAVNDAIQQVMSLAGLGGAAPAPGQAAGSPQGTGTAGAPPAQRPRQAPEKKPVIPNIAGSGASPVRVVPKSIKQLREMGQQAAAEGR